MYAAEMLCPDPSARSTETLHCSEYGNFNRGSKTENGTVIGVAEFDEDEEGTKENGTLDCDRPLRNGYESANASPAGPLPTSYRTPKPPRITNSFSLKG